MKITNLLLATVSVFMILLSGCGTSGNSNSANANIAGNANQSRFKRDGKPADVAVTTEEMVKDFSGSASGGLEFRERENKYENKTVAVTGKIWKIARKNRGSYFSDYLASADDLASAIAKISLYPNSENINKQEPKDGEDFNCIFQNSDAEQIELLRAGDTVTIQGSVEKAFLFNTSRHLKNCIVAEIK